MLERSILIHKLPLGSPKKGYLTSPILFYCCMPQRLSNVCFLNFVTNSSLLFISNFTSSIFGITYFFYAGTEHPDCTAAAGFQKKRVPLPLQYCNPNPLQLTLANEFFFPYWSYLSTLYHVIVRYCCRFTVKRDGCIIDFIIRLECHTFAWLCIHISTFSTLPWHYLNHIVVTY